MSAGPDTPSRQARPARILIVDDSSDNREILQIILEWDGFVTVTAGSGEEALARVAEQPPDLMLLDLGLPGLGGCEVTTQMKSDVTTMDIPIVIISGSSDDAARRRVLRAGAVDFITKPIGRAELCQRVRGVLDLKLDPGARDGQAAPESKPI